METIIRKELKFMMDYAVKAKFLKQALEWMVPDEYYESDIYSVYLDTDQFDLMRICEGKPDYRFKPRLRAYAPVLNSDDTIFFELKKKVEGVSCKRRQLFTLDSLKDFFRTHESAEPVGREIACVLDRYTPKPVFSLYAHRFCWVWKDDPTLRITIDDTLTGRSTSPGLHRCLKEDRPMLKEGMNILEIKCAGNLPLKLSRLLDKLNIRQASFSKAGSIYASVMEERSHSADRLNASQDCPQRQSEPLRALHLRKNERKLPSCPNF